MKILTVNPFEDDRWTQFLKGAPNATVFHSREWMCVLRDTYGFECRVLAVIGPDSLICGGIPYCFANSWMTGKRFISLPFSDYCAPLADTAIEARQLLGALREVAAVTGAEGVEIRGCDQGDPPAKAGFVRASTFLRHAIELKDGIEAVEKRYHKDCVQRKVRKARRQGIDVVCDSSSVALTEFYWLTVLTRRRHGYPPPPERWFANVIRTMPDAQLLLAYSNGTVIAGVVTLRCNDTVYYKYGASDERFHAMGAMPLLYAEMVQRAAEGGAKAVDLGRTELSNTGLALFKERFGAQRSAVDYWRVPGCPRPGGRLLHVVNACARGIVTHAPPAILTRIGAVLYPHMA